MLSFSPGGVSLFSVVEDSASAVTTITSDALRVQLLQRTKTPVVVSVTYSYRLVLHLVCRIRTLIVNHMQYIELYHVQ